MSIIKNKKYHKMRLLEFIMSIIFIIGLVFKLFNWPGNRLFIVISLTILSYYYFIFSFAIFNNIKIKNIFKNISYKDKTALHIILSIFLGMSVSTIINGIMYELYHRLIDINLIVLGIISTLIILILYYIFLKKEIKNWKTIYLRSIIIIVIGISVSFITNAF